MHLVFSKTYLKINIKLTKFKLNLSELKGQAKYDLLAQYTCIIIRDI